MALGRERAAFTTDSYVVSPLEFPRADIGRIAVCGTINDLAVKGAVPLAISAGFIIEEGFNTGRLFKIARSMKSAATEAGDLDGVVARAHQAHVVLPAGEERRRAVAVDVEADAAPDVHRARGPQVRDYVSSRGPRQGDEGIGPEQDSGGRT